MTSQRLFFDVITMPKFGIVFFDGKKSPTGMRNGQTQKVTLHIDSSANAMLEAAAIKLRCSKSAIVEALIRIETGLPVDDPITEWFRARGAKSTSTDYQRITDAEKNAKRPRGARISNIKKTTAKKPKEPAIIHRGEAARVMALSDKERALLWPDDRKRVAEREAKAAAHDGADAKVADMTNPKRKAS